MDNKKFNRSQIVPIAMILFMIILAVTVAASVSGNTGATKKKPMNSGSEQQSSDEGDGASEYNMTFLGVIREINKELKIITLFNTNTREDERLFYKGSTDIIDKFDQVIAISQVQIGEMVDVYYDLNTSEIKKLQISDHAWEYKGVGNLVVDKLNKHMSIADMTYKYTEHLMIVNDDEFVTLLDINNRDELTVKGLGQEIYSIIITKGHGYIRLHNYRDFIGGIVEVGYDVIMPVSEDMLIVAREGQYRITLQNGTLRGTKNINVLRNEEILVDLSEYMIPPEQTGSIYFKILPEGAELYIDNKLTDYDAPVELKYGEHNMKVSLGGYNTYSGVLVVEAPSMRIDVELTEPDIYDDEVESGDDTDPNDVDNEGYNPDNGEDTSTQPETGTTKVDAEHDITITKPVGAEVFLNGVKKGTTPITFMKEIGIHTVSFRQNGYVTKSFTVEVIDDNEDVSFSFPDMVKK